MSNLIIKEIFRVKETLNLSNIVYDVPVEYGDDVRDCFVERGHLYNSFSRHNSTICILGTGLVAYRIYISWETKTEIARSLASLLNLPFPEVSLEEKRDLVPQDEK